MPTHTVKFRRLLSEDREVLRHNCLRPGLEADLPLEDRLIGQLRLEIAETGFALQSLTFAGWHQDRDEYAVVGTLDDPRPRADFVAAFQRVAYEYSGVAGLFQLCPAEVQPVACAAA